MLRGFCPEVVGKVELLIGAGTENYSGLGSYDTAAQKHGSDDEGHCCLVVLWRGL